MSLQFYKPDFQKPVWFCGDFHGYHKNITKGVTNWSDFSGCRDFKDQFEMTDFVVSTINSKVGKEDTLYFGGDWSFAGKDNVKKLRDRILCENIVFILGNHDHHIRNNVKLQQLFTHVSSYEEFRYKGILFCISHYPFGSWNENGRGSVNIYHHCHGNYQREIGRQIDCGFDANGPISLNKVYTLMKNRPIVTVDHHGAYTNYG